MEIWCVVVVVRRCCCRGKFPLKVVVTTGKPHSNNNSLRYMSYIIYLTSWYRFILKHYDKSNVKRLTKRNFISIHAHKIVGQSRTLLDRSDSLTERDWFQAFYTHLVPYIIHTHTHTHLLCHHIIRILIGILSSKSKLAMECMVCAQNVMKI